MFKKSPVKDSKLPTPNAQAGEADTPKNRVRVGVKAKSAFKRKRVRGKEESARSTLFYGV